MAALGADWPRSFGGGHGDLRIAIFDLRCELPLKIGSKLRKCALAIIVAAAAGLCVLLVPASKPPLEIRLISRSNDFTGNELIVVAVTNRSTRPFRVTLTTETMTGGKWRDRIRHTPSPKLVQAKGSLEERFRPPYETTRWLEVPLPPNASPIPWRTRLSSYREMGWSAASLGRLRSSAGSTPFERSRSNTWISDHKWS